MKATKLFIALPLMIAVSLPIYADEHEGTELVEGDRGQQIDFSLFFI